MEALNSRSKTLPDLKAQLKALAEGAGFLLEYRARAIFDTLGFNTVLGPRYIDPNENKQREIDVVATRMLKGAAVRVGIECTNLDDGFILFAQNDGATKFDELDLVSPGDRNSSSSVDYQSFPFPSGVVERALCCEPKKDNNGAPTQLIKKGDTTRLQGKLHQAFAWSVARARVSESFFSNRTWAYVPVVCTGSDLYRVRYENDGLALDQVERVGYRFITTVMSEQGDEVPAVRLIYVVTLKGLEELAIELERWVRESTHVFDPKSRR